MAKNKSASIRWEYHNAHTNKHFNVPELIMLGYDRFLEASPLFDHHHERSYEFVFVESGKSTWEVNDRIYPSHTGQIFHTRPGEWHRARLNFIEPCSIWWMIIADPADTPGWLRLQDDDRLQLTALLEQLPRTLFVGGRVREPFSKLRTIIDQEEPLDSFRARHLILDILLQMSSPSSIPQIPIDLRDAMIRLTGMIEAEPEMRWTNKELAAQVGVSESHFYRLFHFLHGQSPANYIDRLRMNRACQMLGQPGSNVTSVAMDLGFKTSQHFATVFKKYIGMSPTQWRNSVGILPIL